MKIIHCADLHLDSKLTSNFDKDKAKERNNELLHTFIRMVEFAENQYVSGIIIAGDLFDGPIVSTLVGNTVLKVFRDHPDITFYYLRGNHDNGFIRGEEDLPDNLKLFTDKWTKYYLNSEGNCVLAGIEPVNNGGEDPAEYLNLNHEEINIVVLHGQDRMTDSKDDEAINISSYRNKGIDYIALGHIHGYRRNELDSRGIYCYSGCLEGRGYDECGEHGFVLLDIDPINKTVKDTFIPFAQRSIHEVQVWVEGAIDTYEALKMAENRISESEIPSKDIVKIVFAGKKGIGDEIDTDFIKMNLEGDFYALKVEDDTKLSIDYMDYLYDESLKGEFVRLVRESEMPQEDRLMVIKYGINAITGGDL